MEPPSGTPPSRQSSTPQPPLREDCWSEDATFALIEAWGERYLALGRGSLRQQHWLEVADAVNSAAESDDRPRRTDVQCKNRIDTLKKKYKVEKSRVLDSTGARHGGGYVSPWPYFASLDALIGSAFPVRKPSPETPPPARTMLAAVPVPVRPRSHNRSKRTPAHFSVERSLFQRRFFTATTEEEEREESEERSASRTRPRSGKGREDRRGGGFSELAETIERLAEIYERVERKKGREMIELEKQRMQFAKDLEQQRMRWFLETQLHLQKIHKKFKPSPIDGRYL